MTALSHEVPVQPPSAGGSLRPQRTPEDFLLEIQTEFVEPLNPQRILQTSRSLKTQFRERLQTDPACMLPSYQYKLATGRERGRYVALDLGGSTFRIAIIDLKGEQAGNKGTKSEFIELRAFRVGKEVKDLVGEAFFDWMAARIIETLEGKLQGLTTLGSAYLPLALTWSFPVAQTSLGSGRVQAMGKAFRAADGLIDQDLRSLIEAACLRVGLAAKIHILLNDTSATLISQTYTHPSTRFGLILGTGINMAGHLPLPVVGSEKLDERPKQWLAEAHNVIVNAELSMFGQGILARTRWDIVLSQALPRPDFQPLETMVSGMYLGEIMRLILVEAADTAGLFGGVTPQFFQKPYSLGTEMLSILERDIFVDFETAVQDCPTYSGSPYTLSKSDRNFLRSLASLISRRSAAIAAASVHAFWDLRREALQTTLAQTQTDGPDVFQAEAGLDEVVVASSGSVIEKYPGYLEMCQRYIDELVGKSTENGGNGLIEKVSLVTAQESSLLGAGVALGAIIGDCNEAYN